MRGNDDEILTSSINGYLDSISKTPTFRNPAHAPSEPVTAVQCGQAVM